MKAFPSSILSVLAALCIAVPALADAPEAAGIVKSLSGTVSIERNGASIPAGQDMKFLVGDRVVTGPDGKAGLLFEDDTVMSLGPGSALRIEDFQFRPAERKLSFVARILRGTATYLSGQISRLAPDLVRVETPHATIGMRGTHVLVSVD